jgi:hypothetical protein
LLIINLKKIEIMSIDELMDLRNSDEAPVNHEEYTVWLHNKIVDKINHDLWEFRENKSDRISSTYAACNHIMILDSLKKI